MKNFTKKIIVSLVFIFPLVIHAQARFQGIRTFIISLSGIISLLLILVASLGLLAFLWGLVKFIMHAGDAKTHAEGRQFMLWGLIALFVMVSVWGIVRFIQTNLGIQNGGIFRIENLDSNTGFNGSANGSREPVDNGQRGGNQTQPPDPFDPGNTGCGKDSFGNPITMC